MIHHVKARASLLLLLLTVASSSLFNSPHKRHSESLFEHDSTVSSTTQLRGGSQQATQENVFKEDKDNEIQARIVGGESVEDPTTLYPYFVRLDVNNSPYCGGVLMAPDIVVTAGHCRNVGMKVVVNGYDNAYPGSNPNHHPSTILWNTRHSGFNASTFENDIMVLKLANPARHLQYVIPNFDEYVPRAGDDLVVMGLGRTTEEGPVANFLRAVTVQAIDDQTCASMFRQGGITIPKSIMLCAGSNSGAREACIGDSGGPLITGDKRVVGLVSWGVGCGRIEFPGVYTRISGFRNWLTDNLCKLSDFPPTWCSEQEVQPAPTVLPTPTATSAPIVLPTPTVLPTTTVKPAPAVLPTPTVSCRDGQRFTVKQSLQRFRINSCPQLQRARNYVKTKFCQPGNDAYNVCAQTCGTCSRSTLPKVVRRQDGNLRRRQGSKS